MFSVVAVKSRTASSLPYSANEQVVQELGGSTARQPAKLACGNTPYHRCHAQSVNGDWPESRKLSADLVSVSSNPLLSGSLNFFWDFGILRSLLRDWL